MSARQVWEKFCGDRDGLVTWLEATRSQVSAEQARCARLDDLPELLSRLDGAQREADSRTDAFQVSSAGPGSGRREFTGVGAAGRHGDGVNAVRAGDGVNAVMENSGLWSGSR